ncbi:hypothetical protein TYRP_008780, partial [Tyrophagus putrescentiae]
MLPKLLIDDAAANSSPDFAISAVVLTSAIKEVTVAGFHRFSKLKELHTRHSNLRLPNHHWTTVQTSFTTTITSTTVEIATNGSSIGGSNLNR